MRILIITDNLPYPPIDGCQTNIFNLLVQLKKYQDIEVEMLYVGNIKNISPDSINKIKGYVLNLYTCHLFNTKFIRLSRFLFKNEFNINSDFDILLFSTFLSAYTRFNFNKKVKTILYQADSRTLFYSHRKGIKNKLKYYKYKIEQKFIFKYFDKIVFVSELDEIEVCKYTRLNDKTLIIPIGVEKPSDANNSIVKDIDLIFTGNFCFPPNYEGSIRFINEICPKLIKSYPSIKIYFVGRLPVKEMFEATKIFPDNICVTGEVPSLSDYLYRAKIYFSPVYWGSGMKNKILQAMVHKLPIICTFESTAGILNKENFFIVRQDNDWITYIESLINNNVIRLNSGIANYKLVCDNYSYDKIAEKHFVKLFNDLMEDKDQ